jgi:TolB-like protein/tetratricopeptide (TPR) repeat protein
MRDNLRMNFWADLRRRRVYQLAAIYIVGAWLVLQVADIFFPAWGVPDTAMRYVIVAGALCFPIALIFGWMFDITSGGIVRTRPAGADESVGASLGRSDVGILIVLLMAASLIVINSASKIIDAADGLTEADVQLNKPDNSLAILPFENIDGADDTGFFSDGVSEEILHRLSSIRALKVLGRASSFPFGDSDLGSKRISDILGVRYLLDGSVRRQDGKVRLTASLVDDSGFQLWSETFDGELIDIFQFQSEIAKQVATRITQEIVDADSSSASLTTRNTEAYRQFLIGREYFNKRPANWEQLAADAYRRATELDPDYAPPFAGLATVLAFIAAPVATPEQREEIDAALERAFELAPQMAEAFMARGFVAAEVDGSDADQMAAARDYEQALNIDPSQSMAYNWLAIVYKRLGRHADSFAAQDRGLIVDPLNPMLLLNTTDRFLAKSDFEGAIAATKKLLDLPDPPGIVYGQLTTTNLDYGHIDEALFWAKEAVRTYCPKDCHDEVLLLSAIYTTLGMFDEAEFWINQSAGDGADLEQRTSDRFDWLLARGDYEEFTKAFATVDVHQFYYRGMMHPSVIAIGNLLEGRPQAFIDFASLELGIEEHGLAQVISNFDDVDSVGMLYLMAHLYNEIGMENERSIVLDSAYSITGTIRGNKIFDSYPPELLLVVLKLITQGEMQEAAIALGAAFDAGWRDYYRSRNHPLWRDAFRSPEFVPVMSLVKADLDRQRQIVETDDAPAAFRIEFKKLVGRDAEK